MNMANLTVAEQLMFSTTRICTTNDDGIQFSATGFFFEYLIEKGKDKLNVPVIITNKHVVKDVKNLKVFISKGDGKGNPLFEPPVSISLDYHNLQQWVVEHPDPMVDLCLIFSNPIIQLFNKENPIFYKNLNENHIPTQEQLENIDAIEDVFMIGYPNGLWDASHNIPLVRKGITSTPVYIDFNDEPRFLIDAACFPGSSGSPVFYYKTGAVKEKYGGVSIGNSRLFLLGVQHAVPTQPLKGEIRVVPTTTVFSESKIMINLGFIIKSRCILDMKPIIAAKL